MVDIKDVFKSDTSTDDNIDTEGVTLDTLVGEGRKYKDPDALAKSYVHADTALANVKAELAELRMEQRIRGELEAKGRKQEDEPPVNDGNESDQGHEPPVDSNRQNHDKKQFAETEVADLVKKTLEEADKEKTFSTNVNSVASKLNDHFGDANKARQAVERKAAELNVSVDWLLDIAGRSPDAFYRTIDVSFEGSRNSFNSSTGNDVNASALRKTGQRNYKYYTDMLKTDKKAYYSAETQRRMFEDARKMGPDFYT